MPTHTPRLCRAYGSQGPGQLPAIPSDPHRRVHLTDGETEASGGSLVCTDARCSWRGQDRSPGRLASLPAEHVPRARLKLPGRARGVLEPGWDVRGCGQASGHPAGRASAGPMRGVSTLVPLSQQPRMMGAHHLLSLVSPRGSHPHRQPLGLSFPHGKKPEEPWKEWFPFLP